MEVVILVMIYLIDHVFQVKQVDLALLGLLTQTLEAATGAVL